MLGSEDRLGSRAGKYFPYGEDRSSPPPANDQVKFATYTRDSATGMDYADQRSYASTYGRFVSPDPYRASGGAINRKIGRNVARMPRSGSGGMGLSPDGKSIAIVTRESGNLGEMVLTVHVHDVLSGRSLASVIHDRIKSGRRQFLEAGCTVAFTSNGKYLITWARPRRCGGFEA